MPLIGFRTVSRRQAIGIAVAAATSSRGALAVTPDVFRPEDFGARGDGASNDTSAFARMSAAVMQAGGGIIDLRRTTYLVGQQARRRDDPRFSLAPSPIIWLTACAGPVEIRGNGARLRCAPGLRYGSFDRETGLPLVPKLPFYGQGVLATPYAAMIHLERCSSRIAISDVELDGNASSLTLGGQWGDHGWQIAGHGLRLANNTGDEVVERLFAHDHPCDGIVIDGVPNRMGVIRRFSNIRSVGNGRQGCSLVGGSGYRFVDSQFARSGRGKITSAPGAGFDIEAEAKTIRNIAFMRCSFVDNIGCGFVADSGDSAGIAFDQCNFIGTTSWAAWPNKPQITFTKCHLIGASSNCFGGEPGRATRFADCLFSDAPVSGSRGLVYLPGPHGPIVDLSSSANIRFDRCRFTLTNAAVLPWSTSAIYADCVMTQRTAEACYPRGTFFGHNTIQAPRPNLDGAKVIGTLIVNGSAKY